MHFFIIFCINNTEIHRQNMFPCNSTEIKRARQNTLTKRQGIPCGNRLQYSWLFYIYLMKLNTKIPSTLCSSGALWHRFLDDVKAFRLYVLTERALYHYSLRAFGLIVVAFILQSIMPWSALNRMITLIYSVIIWLCLQIANDIISELLFMGNIFHDFAENVIWGYPDHYNFIWYTILLRLKAYLC